MFTVLARLPTASVTGWISGAVPKGTERFSIGPPLLIGPGGPDVVGPVRRIGRFDGPPAIATIDQYTILPAQKTKYSVNLRPLIPVGNGLIAVGRSLPTAPPILPTAPAPALPLPLPPKPPGRIGFARPKEAKEATRKIASFILKIRRGGSVGSGWGRSVERCA